MIGSLSFDHPKIAVVGAGISGLLAAYRLDELGFEVELFEKSSRPGGLIQTEYTPNGISEWAAHSFFIPKQTADFFTKLGVELLSPKKKKNPKWIFRDHGLKKFPLHFREKLALLRGALRSTPDFGPGGPTFAEWAENSLGKSAHDYLLRPFLNGIMGASTEETLLTPLFPQFLPKPGRSLFTHFVLRRLKGDPLGKRKHFAPRFGTSEIIRKLHEHLLTRLGTRYHLSREFPPLSKDPDGRQVLLTCPTDACARLLKDRDAELAQALMEVKYTPLLTATVFLERTAFQTPPLGLGVLIPPSEGLESLGILFNSSSYEERVTDDSRLISLTVFMGGSRGKRDLLSLDDATIERTLNAELKTILGARQPLLKASIHRIPRAIPIYDRALLSAWEVARSHQDRSGVLFFGNWTGEYSIRSMVEAVAKWQK